VEEQNSWENRWVMMDAEDLLQKFTRQQDRLSDVVGPSDVFDRQFGAEFTSWELEFQRQFSERLSGGRVKHRGFVHYTRNTSLFLISHSPWILDGVFVQLPEGLEIPPEGSRVEVTGRNILLSSFLERHKKEKAVLADSIVSLKSDYLESMERPLNIRQMSALLFDHVGMAVASKRVFSQLFLSSPPFEGNVGGLTTGILAMAKKQDVRRFFSFLNKILPPSLRGRWPSQRHLRGVRVSNPKIWRIGFGQFSKRRIDPLCIERKDPMGFREVSLGLLTETDTATLPDVPIVLLSDDFWVETKDADSLRLPIIKSAITAQMLTPRVSKRTVDSSTKFVLSRLEGLKESFGLADSSLARGGILDADALGRPLSTVRLARSDARASWSGKVVAKDIKRVWNKVLEPALKEFIDLYELKKGAEEDWGKDARVYKLDMKVLKALKKLDSGKSTDLGPSIDEIVAEAGVERHVAVKALEEMKVSGVVFEPRPGHFRLV
jgi:hypothetical protein